jgi:hypothetical protein
VRERRTVADEEALVAVPRELIRQIRRLDEYELRRLMILVRGLLLHADGQPDAAEPGLPRGLSYRQEHVRCGKDGCRTCPHGPYWYAYWKEDGRTRKRYIGRQLPGEPLEEVVPDLPASGDGAPNGAPPGRARDRQRDGGAATRPPRRDGGGR